MSDVVVPDVVVPEVVVPDVVVLDTVVLDTVVTGSIVFHKKENFNRKGRPKILFTLAEVFKTHP